MPSPDIGLRAIAKHGPDRDMREEIRILPMAGGVTDNTRGIHDALAKFRAGSEKASLPTGGTSSATWSTRISAGEAKAWITKAAYAGPQVRQRDRVKRRRDGTMYEVAAVNDREADDIILTLNEL